MGGVVMGQRNGEPPWEALAGYVAADREEGRLAAGIDMARRTRADAAARIAEYLETMDGHALQYRNRVFVPDEGTGVRVFTLLPTAWATTGGPETDRP